VAAVVVGTAALRLLVSFRPDRLSELVHAHVDGRVLMITAGISVLTGVVFGVVAGLHGLRASGFGVLREAGSATGDHSRHGTRSFLVVTEMALAAVLVVGASLLVRTVINLYRVNPGFDATNLYAMSFALPSNRYPDDANRNDFARRLLNGANRLAGIERATVAWQVPPRSAIIVGSWQTEGSEAVSVSGGFTDMNQVLPEFFEVMRTRVLAGRTFDTGAADRNEVIISQSLARLLWGDSGPIGRRFRNSQANAERDWYTVVGVVENTAMRSLRDERNTPAIFFPSETGMGFDGATLIVRARSGQLPMAALRALALELDPAIPPPPVERVSDLLARTVSMQRFLTTLLGLFAGLAVTLSAVGLYGVIAYTVRQRIREIGIRVALGAARRDIVRLVVRQGLGLTALGLVLGCCGALVGTRLIRTMLFGVSTLDVSSFAAAAAVLLVIALLACLAPTYRALRVDPAVALRGD
jgi:predicted permease